MIGFIQSDIGRCKNKLSDFQSVLSSPCPEGCVHCYKVRVRAEQPHLFLNSASRVAFRAPTGFVRSLKLAGSLRSNTGVTQLLQSTKGRFILLLYLGLGQLVKAACRLKRQGGTLLVSFWGGAKAAGTNCCMQALGCRVHERRRQMYSPGQRAAAATACMQALGCKGYLSTQGNTGHWAKSLKERPAAGRFGVR